MADIWFDVDAALAEVPVNRYPLIDDTDFKSIEGAVAYNAAGMALNWHFVTTAGAYTVTAVTPTTGGNYDWTDQGTSGVYTIEIPASGGASINNDTEGFGWFTGVATGILPWASPIYGFRAAALNNSLIDGATLDVNATAIGGVTQTGKDIGHADYGIDKLVRSTTPANTLTVDTSHRALSDLASILGTALTETAGYLAAGFKKFFNIETPIMTVESVNQTGDVYAQDIPTLIGTIGSGTGAALNFAPDDDNVDGAIVGAPTFDPVAPFVGVQTSGTFASASGDDGTYHQIDDDTNEIDIIYQFSVGAGRNCAKVVFTGYMGTGTADTCLIKAYNFLTGAWDTRSTLIGQNGSTDKVQDITLLAAHTGTGTYAGKVYLRFDSSASNQVLYVDSLIAQAQNLGQTVGYSDGAIWIGGTNGNTTPYVDGTADNPCTYAASKTLSASLGLTRFRVKDGVTITLDASAAGKSFIGDNWNLALGGQAIAAAYFYGANVTGVSSGVDAWFDHCVIGTATIAQGFFELCPFTGTFTTVASGNYSIINGLDGIPGETNSVWVLTANTILGMRNWSGGINLNNMASTNTVVIDGRGKLILDSNCADGEIRVRGNFDITDNVVGGFLGTLTKTANINTSSSMTITANQSVNVAQLGGSTQSATDLKDFADTGYDPSAHKVQGVVLLDSISRPSGTIVDDAGNSTTVFKTNLTSTEDDYIKDAYIKFTSGADINQVKKISAYNGTSKVITTAAFTDEPAENDTFVIINE